MAVTYGFYNALNHDRVYDAIQMSSIFDGIIRDGIFSTIGETLVCKASGNGLVVNVGSGRAWFNHTWTLNDTDYPVEAEEAEVVLDRIDAIVLEVNSAVEVRANSIKFIKGTPSSNPERPTLTHNAEVNQYALAYVSIPAGKTTIFQSDITSVIGTDETPFITGLLQQVSIENLLLQWEDEFDTYFANFKTTSETDYNTWINSKMVEYAAWYAGMVAQEQADFAEFDAWFQHMKDQLSEDAAGHLQAEIDAIIADAGKGSELTVTTTDPTLINRTLTVSQNGQSVTATFDARGVAHFDTVPYIGTMEMSTTNGILSVTKQLVIPYFGRYTDTIEFWEAILNISTTSQELYNRVITITKNGSAVGSTVFDATGHATYGVHEPGTYTVSATSAGGDEATYDVTVSAETTYNVTLTIDTIPEGATVTPVNDIQTWLKCADITDKSYTTLAEVLADTETFDILLRDSNACDYMSRSTSWALADGLVPVMTSDTTPSGVASASSVLSNYNAYLAFDGNKSTYWEANAASATLKYEFPTAVTVSRVKLYVAENNQTVVLEGSNDDTNYAPILNSFTLVAGEDTFKNVASQIAYKYYRATVTKQAGDYAWLHELQFYSEADVDITTNEEAMARVGKYDYCSESLLANDTWCEAIATSPYAEEIFDDTNPAMTSANTPSGYVISASGSYDSSHAEWKAFDKDENSQWQSSATNGRWVKIAFPSAIIPRAIYVNFINATNRNSDWLLQASVDDSTWVTIKTYPDSGSQFYVSEKDLVIFNSEKTKYRYFRMYTAGTHTYDSDVNEITIYARHESETPQALIHSCPNDTIYIMRNGSPVTVATTDLNGVGEIDWTDFDEGDLTLYSSVAKNPSNLSNDYSKVCRITKTQYGHTTDFYLMPEKSLYWWGYAAGSITAQAVGNILAGTGYGQWQGNTNNRFSNFQAPNNNRGYTIERINKPMVAIDGEVAKYIIGVDSNSLTLETREAMSGIAYYCYLHYSKNGVDGQRLTWMYLPATTNPDPTVAISTNEELDVINMHLSQSGVNHVYTMHALFIE